jgi:hypothetical protein
LARRLFLATRITCTCSQAPTSSRKPATRLRSGTDSGGFQVLSLGAGFGKVLAMDVNRVQADDVLAAGKERLARRR